MRQYLPRCSGPRRLARVLVLGALALFCGVHEVRAASTHARFGDADRLTPIFRDGFSTSGFHDFYRGMANASNWFSIDSMEMLLGLASALVALLALLFLSTERRKGTNEPAAAPAAPTQRPQPKDPIEQRRVRRAEARARRNARAAAETSSRLGS